MLGLYLGADDHLTLTGAEPLAGTGQGQFLTAEDLALYTEADKGNQTATWLVFWGCFSPSESKEATQEENKEIP